MQRNLTLTIDEDLLREARKLAFERNTSVNQIVRNHLEEFVRESGKRRAAIKNIEDIFKTSKARIGSAKWTRDELHER